MSKQLTRHYGDSALFEMLMILLALGFCYLIGTILLSGLQFLGIELP